MKAQTNAAEEPSHTLGSDAGVELTATDQSRLKLAAMRAGLFALCSIVTGRSDEGDWYGAMIFPDGYTAAHFVKQADGSWKLMPTLR